MRPRLLWLFLGGMLGVAPHAEAAFTLQDKFVFLFQAGGDYHLISTDADNVTGATYTHRFRDSLVAGLGMGLLIGQRVYFGVRYEYWFSRRKFSVSGAERTDELRYHGAGPELGVALTTPRSYILFTAAAFYPAQSQVVSTGSVNARYNADTTRIPFQGRISVGVKISRHFSTILYGGYRFQSLGTFSGAAGSLPTGALDFSGPFGGLSLGLHF